MKPTAGPPQRSLEGQPDDRVFPAHHLKAGFIKIPLWLRAIPHLSAGARMVYGTLVWAAGGQKAASGYSVALLATVAGISDRTLLRHLGELERRRLIRRSAPVGNEIHQRYHFLRHPAMYIPKEHLDERPSLVGGQQPDRVGYKATPKSIMGVIRWVGSTRHETGWDNPKQVSENE